MARTSRFTAFRRSAMFLRLRFPPSHFSARGTPDHPDGVFRRFLRQRVHERYILVFRVDYIALFWVFSTVPEALFDPLFSVVAVWTALAFRICFLTYRCRIWEFKSRFDCLAARIAAVIFLDFFGFSGR